MALVDGIGCDLVPSRGSADPERLFDPDLIVTKTGRTTGTTWGRITAAEMSGIRVQYGARTALFRNQIEIESTSCLPFSQGGDSGSLVITPEGEVIGLLFAGTDIGGTNGQGLTYANPIHQVLDALAIEWALG